MTWRLFQNKTYFRQRARHILRKEHNMSVQQQKYTDVVLAMFHQKIPQAYLFEVSFTFLCFLQYPMQGLSQEALTHAFPRGGSLHWCRTQTNRLSCRTTGAKTKFFAFIVVTLAGVYAMKILLTGFE